MKFAHKSRLFCTLAAHVGRFALLLPCVLTRSPCPEGEFPMHRALVSAVLSLSTLLSTLVTAQDASYTYTTLDVPGAISTSTTGINNRGQVVGRFRDAAGNAHG